MDKWPELNAYVDGELEADESAAVAKAAAEDPAVAQDIAALTQLKATLSHCVESFEGELQSPKRRLFSSLQPWHIAASIACLGIIGLLALSSNFYLKNQTFDRFALTEHQRWASRITQVATSGEDGNNLVPTAVTQAGTNSAIPDINAIGLRIVTLSDFRHGDQSGWHIGYLGRNGCKVSLFALTNAYPKTSDTPSQPVRVEADSSAMYFWAAGSKRYYLAASDMSEPRLQIVSQLLHLKTIEAENPKRNDAIIALQDQYTASASCVT